MPTAAAVDATDTRHGRHSGAGADPRLLTGRQTKGAEEAGEGDTALPQLHGGGMHALAPLVIEHRTLTVHDDLEVSEQVGLMARLP